MSEYGQTGQKPVPLLSCDHVQERKAARRRIIEAAIQRRREIYKRFIEKNQQLQNTDHLL